MFKIRQSKYRHVFCDQPKQDVSYTHAPAILPSTHSYFFLEEPHLQAYCAVHHPTTRAMSVRPFISRGTAPSSILYSPSSDDGGMSRCAWLRSWLWLWLWLLLLLLLLLYRSLAASDYPRNKSMRLAAAVFHGSTRLEYSIVLNGQHLTFCCCCPFPFSPFLVVELLL